MRKDAVLVALRHGVTCLARTEGEVQHDYLVVVIATDFPERVWEVRVNGARPHQRPSVRMEIHLQDAICASLHTDVARPSVLILVEPRHPSPSSVYR